MTRILGEPLELSKSLLSEVKLGGSGSVGAADCLAAFKLGHFSSPCLWFLCPKVWLLSDVTLRGSL